MPHCPGVQGKGDGRHLAMQLRGRRAQCAAFAGMWKRGVAASIGTPEPTGGGRIMLLTSGCVQAARGVESPESAGGAVAAWDSRAVSNLLPSDHEQEAQATYTGGRGTSYLRRWGRMSMGPPRWC
mmetsp:Transcript_2355/g.7046  ORF Transcript_2355/g.7046 Transcript_2355/m.7046 type:complete len:125 (-) Transcript_2355:125-499(-)